MGFNIADLFEYTADAVPNRVALIDGDHVQTFAELDSASNRVAHALNAAGVGDHQHIGVYAQNSHAWIEVMLGCFKSRSIPININFRYVADELRYLLDNADCVGVVLDRAYAPTLAAVAADLPKLQLAWWIEDGSGVELDSLAATEVDLAPLAQVTGAQPFDRPEHERTPDDLYVIYTGGTTGMPKGVMWRQEDVYFALGQGIDAMTGERVAHDRVMAERAASSAGGLVFMVIPPLMHGAAQWGTFSQMLQGNQIVLVREFDPAAIWRTVGERGVNSLLITGDAMGRPLIEELVARPGAYDTSSVLSVSSTAAVFSQTVKDQYLDHFPNLVITDSVGSSEGGFNGIRVAGKGQTQRPGGPTVAPGPDVVILDEDLQPIPVGDGREGRLARTGNIPIGYYRDEAKTAATFVTAPDGRRYAIAGDAAQYESDGTITLLGRGSGSINSGGEKIFPEEVESALKDHPAVFDCLVVGVPDERWGQRVAAVVQYRAGHTAELEELCEHARGLIARYKVPRELHVVSTIVRSPSGKPDYPWAKRVALGEEPPG
jgi:acyl-CoA synthetase (AMP-forming)/AMP-acid ligase II